jgi:hypothetical protein
MTQQKLLQHVDEMRERLRQTAATEQSLVRDLGNALNALDQKLLQDVRQVAAEHQTRRGMILDELEALAGSMGMFLPAREAVTTQQMPQQIDFGQQYDGEQYAPSAGDWRLATKNLSFEDEFERHLNERNQPH